MTIIDRIFKKEKTSIPDRTERLEWILEHITPDVKQEMLIAVIIEIMPDLTWYERKIVQRIIERCQ